MPNGRFENLLELLHDGHVKFQDGHTQLLTAQVVLTDRVDRLAQTLAQAVKDLTEAQKHTGERLNALITVVDDVVRRRPTQ